MKHFSLNLTLLLALTLLISTFSSSDIALADSDSDKSSTNKSYSPYVGIDYPRNVYWGDTHLHTTFSADAGMVGNFTLGPKEAYRFARGEEVEANNGMRVKLIKPLDFLAVSDHSEYMGLMPLLRVGDEEILKSETGKRWYNWFNEGPDGQIKAFLEFGEDLNTNSPRIEFTDIARTTWDYMGEVADKYNDPGHFTAFIAYEWTSTPAGDNLHRVVLFRDGKDKATKVVPLSSFDTVDPEDLWNYMADYEKNTGGRVLAIPHNGNVSNGLMFSAKDMKGTPLTKAYAKTRMRWEPLYEVTQIKGDGETHPLLSPDDEFADYENWDGSNLTGTKAKEDWMLQYEYGRSALKMGLQKEQELGVNPFKFGMIGSTDSHTSLATAREDNFFGKASILEPGPGRAAHVIIPSVVDPKLSTWGWQQVASGLAAVWATDNTREALFDAMQRKETYATTGPRMTVRFFGGWDYGEDDVQRHDFASLGYSKGVPMGGDLTKAPSGKSPAFLIQALRDPDGANLDRVQVIKGWLDAEGETHERIYDVAVSDGRKIGKDGRSKKPVGNTVDIEKATFTNSIGDAMLTAYWSDPDFDPNEHAFYYARVIEIPKPRWSAYDAKRFGVEMPEGTEMITQDRAYTSPIWYTPAK